MWCAQNGKQEFKIKIDFEINRDKKKWLMEQQKLVFSNPTHTHTKKQQIKHYQGSRLNNGLELIDYRNAAIAIGWK